VGLIDWNEPGKYGGKVNKVEVGGGIVDLTWSEVERDVLGVVTSAGVHTGQMRRLIVG
jgi:hypothetical protein